MIALSSSVPFCPYPREALFCFWNRTKSLRPYPCLFAFIRGSLCVWLIHSPAWHRTPPSNPSSPPPTTAPSSPCALSCSVPHSPSSSEWSRSTSVCAPASPSPHPSPSRSCRSPSCAPLARPRSSRTTSSRPSATPASRSPRESSSPCPRSSF